MTRQKGIPNGTGQSLPDWIYPDVVSDRLNLFVGAENVIEELFLPEGM